MSKIYTKEELRSAFNEYDNDGSGYLEVQEVLNLSKDLDPETNEEEFTELFMKIDKNMDMKISFEEFSAWFRVGRTSKMTELMENHLKLSKQFNGLAGHFKGLKALQKPKKDLEGDVERSKLIDFSVNSGESEGKTLIKIDLKTGKKNKLPGAMKLAFPTYNEKEPHFYMTLRGNANYSSKDTEDMSESQRAFKNAQKLANSINKFFSNLMLTIEMQYPNLYKAVENLTFKVSQINTKAVIIINPGESEMTLDFKETMEEFNSLMYTPNPNFSLKIRSNMDLKYCVERINRAEEVGQMNANYAEAIMDETNLLKFLVSGFGLSISLSCRKSCEADMGEFMDIFIEDLDKDFDFKGRLLKYYNNKFKKNLVSMTNIPLDNIEQKLRIWNKKNPDIPDAADLVDELGFFFEKHQDFIDKCPFIEEFFGELKDFAVCDFELGFLTQDSCLSFGVATSGVVELYGEVGQGMQVVDVENNE